MSDALSALLHFSDHDFSWLAQFFSLLVLPFAHEDIAIILGAYIVVNDIMPVGLVALCIYGGMVASDFALYGIGAGARHVPWLTRLAVDDRVRGFADALKRNLFALVALCRVVPGVVFFVFIACGWTRVPLGRFTVASLLVSALYLPLMLCIVIFFGDALDNRVGLWTWPFLLCVLVAIGFVRRQVFAFQDAARSGTAPTPAAAEMEPYDATGRRDPFRPFVTEPRAAPEQVAFTTPLQRFELGQLRVVGTIWKANPPRAMVEDSAGMGYIVGIGTTIGRSNGVVTAIEPQRIIVEERVLDYFGKEQVNRIVMATPREEGPDQAERERK